MDKESIAMWAVKENLNIELLRENTAMLRLLFSFFLFLFFNVCSIAQTIVTRDYGIPIGVDSWDHKIPLQQFMQSCHYGGVGHAVILLGYSDKSVFSYEAIETDASKGNYDSYIAETDTNGRRTLWSPGNVIGWDSSDTSPNKVNLHLEQLTPVEAWPCLGNYWWVVKANIKKLKKCFVWYFKPPSDSEMDDDNSSDFTVKVTPYNYTHQLMVTGGVSLTAPVPCHADCISPGNWRIISRSDTMFIAIKNDTLSPVPFRWLKAAADNKPLSIQQTQLEMNHPDSAMLKNYPLLKTNTAELVRQEFRGEEDQKYRYDWIIILKPISKQAGIIYGLKSNSCAEEDGYVIVQSPWCGVSVQGRYLRVMGTLVCCQLAD